MGNVFSIFQSTLPGTEPCCAINHLDRVRDAGFLNASNRLGINSRELHVHKLGINYLIGLCRLAILVVAGGAFLGARLYMNTGGAPDFAWDQNPASFATVRTMHHLLFRPGISPKSCVSPICEHGLRCNKHTALLVSAGRFVCNIFTELASSNPYYFDY